MQQVPGGMLQEGRVRVGREWGLLLAWMGRTPLSVSLVWPWLPLGRQLSVVGSSSRGLWLGWPDPVGVDLWPCCCWWPAHNIRVHGQTQDSVRLRME